MTARLVIGYNKRMRYEAILDVQQKISSRQYENPCAYLHFHRSIELHYVVRGKILARTAEEEHIVHAGEIMFIPSYYPHSVQSLEESVVEVFIVSHNYFEDFEKQNVNLTYSLLKNTRINQKIYEYMLLAKQELDEQPSFLIRGYIAVIFGLIVKYYESEKAAAGSARNNIVEQIISYIEEHYREDITLDSLAKRYNFNKYYFSKLFNKMFGCTLRYYINNVRVNHILTDESHKSVTERILDAGFKDISTFYKYKKNLYKFS